MNKHSLLDSETVQWIRKGFEGFGRSYKHSEGVRRIRKVLEGFPPAKANQKQFFRLGENPIMIAIIFGE